jgi:hypothetical protein
MHVWTINSLGFTVEHMTKQSKTIKLYKWLKHTYATMLQLKPDCNVVWRYRLFRTMAGFAPLFTWNSVQER